MDCDYCENPATVFLSQLSGDQLKKVCLCDSCSSNSELIKSEGLEALLGDQNEIEVPLVSRCPSCHFSLENFSSVGRLGCPTCYQFFHAEIVPRLEALHRGTTHEGKAPAPEFTVRQRERKSSEIQKRLAEAVAREDFEKAAALRDELNRLLI